MFSDSSVLQSSKLSSSLEAGKIIGDRWRQDPDIAACTARGKVLARKEVEYTHGDLLLKGIAVWPLDKGYVVSPSGLTQSCWKPAFSFSGPF